MSAGFSAVWQDSGFLNEMPPFLVVPLEGIGLLYLEGVRSPDVRRDFKFDGTNLTVTPVHASDLTKTLMLYADNFPQNVLTDVLALQSAMRSKMNFGSALLAVEGSISGSTSSLDYITRTGRAKLDVYTTKRRTVTVAFLFIRYQDDTGAMKAGTTFDPSYAEELVRVLNRLFLPSANVELTLKVAQAKNVSQRLGPVILTENFRKFILPLRDTNADVTVFFVGRYKGDTDPLGQAFKEAGSVVVNDFPKQYIAPIALPSGGVSDDQIYYEYTGQTLDRPASDRDLHIVLAHEIAHLLGAGHNNDQDNIMSMRRQDFKLNKSVVKAING
jgi:Matrixin